MNAAVAHTKLCPICLSSYEEAVGYCPVDGEILERMEDLLPPGALVAGKFRVHQVLGFGGMGIVYLATQEDIEREVALKVPRREASREPGAVERFRRGARAASRIGDRRIVTIYDFGSTEDGLLYIAMERLAGKSLRDRMEPVGEAGERELAPLPLEEALRIGHELAGGLAAAHAVGVVHRDLKPENVMLTADGPKILDFGIARIEQRGGIDQTTLTRKGALIGTARYISPEGAERKTIGPPADLYALGVILHEMVTGKRLFEEKVPELLIALHASMYPETINEAAPEAGFGEGLEELIESLLEKDPAARPSATEVEARLLHLRDDPNAPALGTRAPRSGSLRLSDPGPRAAPARSRPAAAAAPAPAAASGPLSPDTHTGSHPAQAASEPAQPRSTQPGWLLPTLAGGGLLILALVSALLYVLFRGPEAPPGTEAAIPVTLPATAPGGEAATGAGAPGAGAIGQVGEPGEGAGGGGEAADGSGSSEDGVGGAVGEGAAAGGAAAGAAGASPGQAGGQGANPRRGRIRRPPRPPRPGGSGGAGLSLPPPPTE